MSVHCIVLAGVSAWFSFALPGEGQPPEAQPKFVPLRLRRVDASKVAKRLMVHLGRASEVTIFSDEESNTVLIRASPEMTEKAKGLVARWDVDARISQFVIPLKTADAAKTAMAIRVVLTLTALFDNDNSTYVSVDEKGNRIVLAANERKYRQVQQILHWLDSPPQANGDK